MVVWKQVPEKHALLVRFSPVPHTTRSSPSLDVSSSRTVFGSEKSAREVLKEMSPGLKKAVLTLRVSWSCAWLTPQLEGARASLPGFAPAWVWYSGLTASLQTLEDHMAWLGGI